MAAADEAVEDAVGELATDVGLWVADAQPVGAGGGQSPVLGGGVGWCGSEEAVVAFSKAHLPPLQRTSRMLKASDFRAPASVANMTA